MKALRLGLASLSPHFLISSAADRRSGRTGQLELALVCLPILP
jgi:hypothetical protein